MGGFARPIVKQETADRVAELARIHKVKKWKIYEKAITFFDPSGIDG